MKLIIGPLIAVIFLFIYGVAVITAIGMAKDCSLPTGCTDQFSSYSYALNTIGAIVSALVIAELAITQPSTAPIGRIFSPRNQNHSDLIRRIITVLYLVGWLILGLSAFIFGVMKFPDKVADLTSLGKEWLGLAAAAVYAYFGIKPS